MRDKDRFGEKTIDGDFQRMQDGFHTAFIDSESNSETGFRPQFISNDYRQGKKVISAVEGEMKRCDEFFISVAFITKGGITPLLQTLKELESRGVKGRILTTDYLNFSEPEALRKLDSLKNLEVRMYLTTGEGRGFHTKGYVFRQGGLYRMILGSANMTMTALSVTREWNATIDGKGRVCPGDGGGIQMSVGGGSTCGGSHRSI